MLLSLLREGTKPLLVSMGRLRSRSARKNTAAWFYWRQLRSQSTHLDRENAPENSSQIKVELLLPLWPWEFWGSVTILLWFLMRCTQRVSEVIVLDMDTYIFHTLVPTLKLERISSTKLALGQLRMKRRHTKCTVANHLLKLISFIFLPEIMPNPFCNTREILSFMGSVNMW